MDIRYIIGFIALIVICISTSSEGNIATFALGKTLTGGLVGVILFTIFVAIVKIIFHYK